MVAVWSGHCHLWWVVGGLSRPSRGGGFMHPARDGNVVRACGWLEGTGRCVFCATTELDLVRPWGLAVTGLVSAAVWLVGRGGWVVVVLHFSSFFGLPMGLCMAGWLGGDEGFPGGKGL